MTEQRHFMIIRQCLTEEKQAYLAKRKEKFSHPIV